MEIDSRTLELLEAIASDGTLTAASRRLHISQPALSQRLTGLESRLGVRLFERDRRRLIPTRAGSRMVSAATSMLGELRAASRDLDDLRRGNASVVRFTSQCTTTYQWLAPLLQEFRDTHHEVDVRIESVSCDEAIPALFDDRVDVALISKLDRNFDAVATRALFDDEMMAVVPIGHPWASRPFVEAADFDGVHLVLSDTYDQTRVPAQRLPIPADARPGSITFVPPVNELIVEMVLAGQGVGLLSEWVAEPYRRTRDVALVQVTANPERRTWWCATRRGPLPEPVAAFVDIVVGHFTAQHADA